MKKIILTIFVLANIAMASIYNLDKHKINITKDIHCVIGDFKPPKKSNKGFVSNMCYVNMGDNIALFDAGPTYKFAREFEALIKKDYPNKKIKYVILSNYHDDRTYGASYFKDRGATIIGGEQINNDIKNNPEKFQRFKNIFSKKLLKGTKIIKADVLAKNGYTIKGKNKSIKILKPSVSSEEKSDIIIYVPQDKFVFAGNIVFNGRMLNYTKHSSVDGWIKAIEKIISLKAKYVLGGHGKEYDKNSYKASLQYLKTLRKDVKKAYDNDVDVIDIKLSSTIYQKNNIPFFRQLNTSNINHYYEQLEFD